MAKTNLTAERLRELLDYDPAGGGFRWRVQPKTRQADVVAGFENKFGYRVIKVDGTAYKGHRLAWLYIYGRWPDAHIDHVNGVKSDNRIANLRDVQRTVNLQNQRSFHKGAKAELLGVSPFRDKWKAQIHADGVNRYLGLFPSKEQAHAVYMEAKRRLHEGCTI